MNDDLLNDLIEKYNREINTRVTVRPAVEVVTFSIWSGWNGGSSITYTVMSDGKLTITERRGKDVSTTEIQLTDDELARFVDFSTKDIDEKGYESTMIFDMGTTIYVGGKEFKNVDELNQKMFALLKEVDKNHSTEKEEEDEKVDDDEIKEIMSFDTWSGWSGGSSKNYSITDDGILTITEHDRDGVFVRKIQLNEEEVEAIANFINDNIVDKEYESQRVFDAGFVLKVGDRQFENVEELNRKALNLLHTIVDNHNEKYTPTEIFERMFDEYEIVPEEEVSQIMK